jgi:molybdopterin-guanine dinucleotide biosynthesis protein B
VTIVGKSGTGKTTLIEKLIPALNRRGFRVGAIKHAHHGFQFDREGKDSWRHMAAGAQTILVAAPGQIAMVKQDGWHNLQQLRQYFPEVDLIIAEGFKKESHPKIEIVRAARSTQPLCVSDPTLIGFISDVAIDTEAPVIGLEDIEAVADLIVAQLLQT